jgi:branched-chain amino acid transport system substrate-binding protein
VIKHGGVAIAIITMGLVVGACGSSGGKSAAKSAGTTGSSPTTAGLNGTFTVATVQALSGTYAGIGADLVNGMKAEASLLNASGGVLGKKVVINAVDDASDPQRAIAATQQLVQSGNIDLFIPEGVLGKTTLPFVKDLLATSSCSDPDCGDPSKYPLMFTTNPPASSQVPAVLAYAQQQKWTKIAVFSPTTTSGQDFNSLVKENAPKYGLTIVGNETYDAAASTYTAQLQKLKSSSPDALVSWTLGASTGIATSNIQGLGWNVPILGTPAAFSVDVNKAVPPPVQPQYICVCYGFEIRSGADVPSNMAKIIAASPGPVANLPSFSFSADDVLLAAWAYNNVGKLDKVAAANAIQNMDSAPNKPVLWSFPGTSPGYSSTAHRPNGPQLAKSFFAIAHVGPNVSGTYPGTPFSFTEAS